MAGSLRWCGLGVALAATVAWGQVPPELANMPGMWRLALGYPDKQLIRPQTTTLTLDLSIGGEFDEQKDDRRIHSTVSWTGQRRVSEDLEQVTDTVRLNAKLQQTETAPKWRRTTTTVLSYENTRHGERLPGGVLHPIVASEQEGRFYFTVALDHDIGWESVEMPATTTIVTVDQNGEQTIQTAGQAHLMVRIPYHCDAARNVEAAGKDVLPFLGYSEGGIIEAPWKDGGTSGTITFPMQAQVGLTGPIAWVNSHAAFAAMGRADPDAFETFPLADATLRLGWAVNRQPNETRLLLTGDESYPSWLPTPEREADGVSYGAAVQPVEVTATIQPRDENQAPPVGRIDFYLEEVSRHPGRCVNWPRGLAEKDDLRFVGGDVTIDPADPKHAWTEGRVSSATVLIEALDTGASGRVRAVCEELNLMGEEERTGRAYLAVPLDDDGNTVADCWEKERGLTESPAADWDEETSPGGGHSGDSLTLADEYRGFVVLENGRPTFRRLDPKRRELFVIDAGGSFDVALWEQASDIPAYRVDETMVRGGADLMESRVVDWMTPGTTHKYAVRLETIHGADPSPAPDVDGSEFGYCQTAGGCPRNARMVKVFPDRIRAWVDDMAGKLFTAVADPNSSEGKAYAALDLPPWLLERALARLDPAAREQLTNQELTVTALHEVGHACGLPGHLDATGAEAPSGPLGCPMRYEDNREMGQFIALQTLFASDQPLPVTFGRFCTEGPRCLAELNVKD